MIKARRRGPILDRLSRANTERVNLLKQSERNSQGVLFADSRRNVSRKHPHQVVARPLGWISGSGGERRARLAAEPERAIGRHERPRPGCPDAPVSRERLRDDSFGADSNLAVEVAHFVGPKAATSRYSVPKSSEDSQREHVFVC